MIIRKPLSRKRDDSNCVWVARALFLAIFLGCAAYQAGNILGAVSGLALLTGWPVTYLTVAVGLVCAGLLWVGSTQGLANMLGLAVFAMGGAFIYVAFGAPVTPVVLAKALALTGVGFGLANATHIPVIVAVQAINGILLPFVTVFLWRAINDRALLGEQVNSAAQNVAMGLVVAVTAVLGGWNVWLAVAK
jgi:manganese transport protein